MRARPRLLVFVLAAIASGPAGWAQPAAERAEALNGAGKRLFGDGDFEGALVKFRQAIVIAPLGKYYFNVCFTLSQLKRYREAITACEAVANNDADAKLASKTDELLTNLRGQVAASSPPPGDGNVEPGTAPATDGSETALTGAGPGASAAGPPPPPMAVGQVEAPIHHDYNWALGFELFGLNNISVGGSLANGDDRFSDGGFQFRATGTMTLNKRRRLAGQAYIGYSVLPQDAIASTISDSPLSLVDLGAAGLWHVPLTRRLYLTPLVGAHISLQGPSDSPEVFIAAGARFGASIDWVLGRDGRHALSLSSAANVYTRAGGESNGRSPADFGLDSGGVTAVFGIAYTLRFQTPLGQLPIFTLE